MILFDEGGAGARTAQMMRPDPSLRPYAEHFWLLNEYVTASGERWRIPPDANPYLIFTVMNTASGVQRTHCRLIGPASEPFDMPVAGRTFTCGVRLRPGVLPLLIRLPAFELTGSFLEIEDAFGARGRQLLERLSEPASWNHAPRLMAKFLAREFASSGPFVPLPVRRANSVHELVTTTGWSTRTLQNRVMEQIGMTPKLWLRIERLHRAIMASLRSTRSWSDIAVHCGFADQAHMVREFVDLLGESPTKWRKRGPFAPQDETAETSGTDP